MFRTVGTIIKRLRQRLKSDHPAAVRARLMKSGLLTIGRHTYGSPRIDVFKGSEAPVSIGSFCSISKGVVFITGGVHPVDWVSLFPFRIKFGLDGAYEDGTPATRGAITVGNDVWIGTDALILSGVTIGHGAVVAARSVVTRDVAPYSLVAGVPAKLIRMRFPPATIERLLRIEWWNWPDEKIVAEVPFLSSPHSEIFISRYDRQDHFSVVDSQGNK